jgi:hypothetical protein
MRSYISYFDTKPHVSSQVALLDDVELNRRSHRFGDKASSCRVNDHIQFNSASLYVPYCTNNNTDSNI